MVVAVIAVRMVQMPVNQVVNVVAVRNGRMTAVRTMHMASFMTAALVVRTTVWVGF